MRPAHRGPARSTQAPFRGGLTGPRATQAAVLRAMALTAIAREQAARRRRRLQRIWTAALLISAGSVAGVFQSCAGGKGNASRSVTIQNEPIEATPSEAGASAPGSIYEEAAAGLKAMYGALNTDDQEPTQEIVPPTAPSSAFAAPTLDEPEPDPAPAIAADPASAAAEPEPFVGPTAPPAVSVQQRRAELTAELASLLRPGDVDNPDLLQVIASLIALEAIHPGAATPEIESALKPLAPEEAAAVRVAADLVRKLTAQPNLVADPSALRAELAAFADRLAAAGPGAGESLALGNVALCSRVESFGRYTPLAGRRFLAGRTNAAIVYAEVDRFTQKPAAELPSAAGIPDEALAVELTVETELFHDDGSRQWRSGEATVRDVSRTRRRDFYLVQRIDLPANLSVGKYNLKVTVRDRLAPGAAVAETAFPIEIVADPGLLGGPPLARPAAKDVVGAPKAGPEPLAAGPR